LGFTRILFVTDVHGSDPVWKKFIRGAQHYKANVLILGGDITGKSVVDVTQYPDGTYFCEFQGQKHVMKSKEELGHFDEILRQNGAYMYVAEPKELSELALDKSRADRIFSDLILQRLKEWVDYADSRATTPIYVNAGNDDESEVDLILAQSKSIIQPEDRVIEIDPNHEMISAGFANLTPWHCPRDLSEDEIETRLESKIAKLKDPHGAIFNFHCPPVDSGLDTCVKLDDSFDPPKPVVDGGGPVLFGAGSTSVRVAIEKYQPMLGLHGHIHESKNVARIGKTICINPGSEYGEGIMRGVLVNFNEKGYKSYQFVSG
jgi:Icc-related predicted phosphoesterase